MVTATRTKGAICIEKTKLPSIRATTSACIFFSTVSYFDGRISETNSKKRVQVRQSALSGLIQPKYRRIGS